MAVNRMAAGACGLTILVAGCMAGLDGTGSDIGADTDIVASRSKPSLDEQIARGQYLVDTIGTCGNCHTMKGPDGDIEGMYLAGGQPITEHEFTAIAANITPAERTGIGTWSVDEIVTAIREGTRPDGTIVRPPMPIALYRDLSDADAYAIAHYLKTVPPVENEVGESEYHIPLPDSYGPPVGTVPEVLRDKPAAYGAYLAGPVGHCTECHTPMDENFQLRMDLVGAGGREFPGPWGVSVSRDIRAGDPDHGIGAWSDDEIVTAITKGVRPDGSHLMPPMGFGYYDGMTDEDLYAIVAYLRTLSP